MTLLFLIALGSICNAQQSIKIVEKLPDGSYVIAIDGVEFRAITGDKAVELAKQKVDLDACKKISAEKDIQIKELTLLRDLAEAQKALVQQKADSFKADFDRSQEDAKRNFGLFMGERQLRIESQQFIPHGSGNGLGVKILKLFDSPYGQAGIKLVNPLVQTAIMSLRKCTP